MNEQETARTDPSTPSMEYLEMTPRWKLISAVLAGREALTRDAATYLPKHPREEDEAWRARVQMARFLPVTGKTLEVLAAMPFTKPVQLGKDVPKALVEIAENLDQEGNNLDMVAQQWFREGLAKGVAWVLVDAPQRDPDAGALTLAEQRRHGIRPYWVMYRPEQVLSVRTEMVNGRKIVVHARIYEATVEEDGFAEVLVHRIRLLEPGKVTIYRKNQEREQDEWFIESEMEISEQEEVPLVRFCSDVAATGTMLCDPPLYGLAEQNLSHFRSQSDQVNCLTVARFPLLAASGVTEDEARRNLEIGPNRWLASSNPDGRFYYVEHTGKAIDAGQKDLDKLEAQMATYGAMFLQRQPGSPTATARALDTAEAVTPLEAISVLFKDALETAMAITARWMGVETKDDGGSVAMQTSIPPLPGQGGDMLLAKARERNDISRAAFLRELVRRGIMVDDYDAEADLEEIEADLERTMSRMPRIDIDPQQEDPEPDEDEDEPAEGQG